MSVTLKLSDSDAKIVAEVLFKVGNTNTDVSDTVSTVAIKGMHRSFGKESIMRISAAFETAVQANKTNR